MWIRASTPPMSTNAPKRVVLTTRPVILPPTSSSSMRVRAARTACFSSSALRLTTALPWRSSNSMTRTSSVRPTHASRSGTGRLSTWEAGKKARKPRSTDRPPFTAATTTTSMGSPLCSSASTRSQTASAFAFASEHTMRLPPGTKPSRRTLSSSPTAG